MNHSDFQLVVLPDFAGIVNNNRILYMKYYLLVLSLLLVPFPQAEAQNEQQNILFFGDSITAGLGVGPEQAFPALIRQKIDSLGWNFTVQNGGLSGETTAGGLRRIDWMLQKPVDVFILELGGNDGLRGIDLESTRRNLQQIIDKVQSRYPDAAIVLAGMQVPPNLGPQYTRQFRAIYPELAKKNDITLIPFLLEEVGGNPDMMQGDGLHPNARGHARIAALVWDTLKPILERRR